MAQREVVRLEAEALRRLRRIAETQGLGAEDFGAQKSASRRDAIWVRRNP